VCKQRSRPPLSNSHARLRSGNCLINSACGTAFYGSRAWDPSATTTTRPRILRKSQPRNQWSVVYTGRMGHSSKSRTRQPSGSGKGLLRGARDLDSRRPTRTSLDSPAKPPSPPASTSSDPEAFSKAIQHHSPNEPEDIAPEIVVWTENMDDMMVDSPEAATPANPATPVVEEKAMYVLHLLTLHTRPLHLPLASSHGIL
jgi:hypothetical protein